MNEKKMMIGLMSGTSLDGLDIVYCAFENDHFKILVGESVSFSDQWRDDLAHAHKLKTTAFIALDIAFGKWMGQQVNRFINKHSIDRSKVSIASHGHTIFHNPAAGYSKQIGSGLHMALETGCAVINNFRARDLALGGQGAPLVPIGDAHLFRAYTWCLNLGGISNISYQIFEDKKPKRIAFDIGICNMALNYLANKKGKPFDKDGLLAKKGKLDAQLFIALNNLPFYAKSPPKSTGFEWFNEAIKPLLDHSKSSIEAQLNTLVEHIAISISETIISTGMNGTLLITGGGALNKYLIEKLRVLLDENIDIHIPTDGLVEFKEALIFAYMGYRKLNGKINCLASVTGASKDNIGGDLYLPN